MKLWCNASFGYQKYAWSGSVSGTFADGLVASTFWLRVGYPNLLAHSSAFMCIYIYIYVLIPQKIEGLNWSLFWQYLSFLCLGGLLYVCSGMHTVQFGSSTYSYLRWNWIDDRCPVSESDSKLSDTLTSHTHAAEGLGRVARSSDKNNHSLRRQRQPWTPGFQLLLFQQFFGKSEISIHCHFGVLWFSYHSYPDSSRPQIDQHGVTILLEPSGRWLGHLANMTTTILFPQSVERAKNNHMDDNINHQFYNENKLNW